MLREGRADGGTGPEPAIIKVLEQRYEDAYKLGMECRAFVVWREDLAEVEQWLHFEPTRCYGVPVYALRGGQGMALGAVFVVRLEDLSRTEKAAPVGSQVVGVERGDCWAWMEEGEGVPRSD